MSVKVLKIKVLLFIILISTSTSFSQDTISHVVKKGETLYSISKLYEVEISELKKQNNLLTNELSINQKIIFVKNQMNGNVVIVRVVGKLPNTGNNDKISIRLSSIAFDKLDAIDSIIPVELTYVKSKIII